MKANKYYTKMEELYINDEHSIPSNQCTEISVKFTIDARHLVLAILDIDMGNRGGKEPTRAEVEKELRKQLNWEGQRFEDRIESGLSSYYCDLEKTLPRAIKIAQGLFPEFMGLPNSILFMKDRA